MKLFDEEIDERNWRK